MSLCFATRVAVLSCWASVAIGASAQPAPHAGHGHAAPSAHPAKPQSAQSPTVLDAHTREDIARHQSMARAHSQAAQCLEAGQSAAQCLQQLQQACKGLALGKNCGMRHSH